MTVILPGSFDPPTNGHLNLISRTSSLFDNIYVVVANNPHKMYHFSPRERVDMLKELTKEHSNIAVVEWKRLIVEFATEVNARIIIRGVRSVNDFTYEFELGQLNKRLAPNVDTLLLPTELHVSLIRSSTIMELIRLGGDISRMVPPSIQKKIEAKINS